jgi:hypothetical protein
LHLIIGAGMRGEWLNWFSFLIFDENNLSWSYWCGQAQAGVARAWSVAEQTGRLLPCGAARLRSEAERKSDWFRERQRTDKGSGFVRLSDGAGAQGKPLKPGLAS